LGPSGSTTMCRSKRSEMHPQAHDQCHQPMATRVHFKFGLAQPLPVIEVCFHQLHPLAR
jgi:hypothetical protein